MYKSKGIGWKGALVATLLGGTAAFGIGNYDRIEKKIESFNIDSIFAADAKFNDYKGEWEPYSFHAEDRTMYNVGLRCVKKMGANGEHWRNQIADYPKNKRINWGKLQNGDSFWVPKDCDCSAPYRKK
ncbi:MAG: hypothetical protein NTY20_03230 [Candidatus Aenigmarchaeota archaeon]|nr:hypothetical protein [Candidatus Aenigmarchaeota archaeon]